MGAQDHDYGCGLREVVNQFVADTNLHPTSPDLTNGPRIQPSQRHRGGSFSPLNLQSATGAHERVEVPARKLDLTNVDTFSITDLVRVPTSIKPVGRIVCAWSGGELSSSPPAYRAWRSLARPCRDGPTGTR